MENTYTFTSREEQLLIYAIAEAISSTEKSINFYARHGDMELAENERKDLSEFKALYKRFLPHLTNDDPAYMGYKA